jgi:hypothetical protein
LILANSQQHTMTTSTQPQTIQQQVLHVIQRASLTRTPGMTPREVLAAHQRAFDGRLTVDDIKTHMHALATAGHLVRMDRRTCTMCHQAAQQVRAAITTKA